MDRTPSSDHPSNRPSTNSAADDEGLPPPESDLRRRRWIWQAVSELFLDEEIDEQRLRSIARTAAECGYSGEQLDEIYRNEVAPAVAFNLFDVAGAWGYFDTIWLEKKILRPRRLVYWFDRHIIAAYWIRECRGEWAKVMNYLVEERRNVDAERAKEGESWKPCWANEHPVLRWVGPPDP